jgi:hypothetical protein
MNFKSVTINLLLTTLSGGVLLQTLEAQAASITFDPWNFNPPAVIKSGSNTTFGSRNANASGRSLDAFAATSFTINPVSILNNQNARATISLSNFFTVTPGPGEKKGDKVDGILSGRLIGILQGSGVAFGNLTGSFNTQVDAEVDAGFASYRPSPPFQNNQSALILGISREEVNDDFSVPGTLTIGERYPFYMKLSVSASKSGAYQTISNFGGEGKGLTANVLVKPVPEPLTMLASATALGFGAFFKRQHSKKPQKS